MINIIKKFSLNLVIATNLVLIAINTQPLYSQHTKKAVFIYDDDVDLTKKEYVILFHGISKSYRSMNKLAKALSGEYEVVNIDYPSTDYDIEKLADIIYEEQLKKLNPKRKVNFVGQSMGGIVARVILNKYSDKFKDRIDKVVFLSTPNQGSELADLLHDVWPFKQFYGPALKQLTTDVPIKNLVGEPYYEYGVIAGKFSIEPTSFIIKGDDDGRVSVENAKIVGMKHFLVVNASHPFFPKNKQVIEQTSYFLKNNKFK